MEEKDVFDYIVESTADIASIKTTLEETLKPLVDKVGAQDARIDAQETRQASTESDVKGIRRIFGGLFTSLLVAGAAAVNWLKP